ncbi:uncharacterized protein L3040_006054 [Drepanopeziza brunnea f. sp. 'multigermtubi']|uniref:uncharacterized protein n=1 Tax=Drepanopeziza brunnea f. sp. 'multigermtubi' TaxID=698441 RepID=UPI0023842341|nr:hypothetical protein L3040_006054 [Drepanopeziza brunnea f. sp. 'multigermtubi']
MANYCFLCTLIWALCFIPTYAILLPGRAAWNQTKRSEQTGRNQVGNPAKTTTTTNPYVFSAPSAQVVLPSPTSEGATVASVVSVYEVCNMPGSSTTTCSTVFETVTEEACSTVLTYAFSKTTISECTHNVTFSTHVDFALSTTTLPVTSGAQATITPSTSIITYAQSTVSYYAAPWQSLAADTPTGITVLICTTDFNGIETCSLIEEVWVVHTIFVPVTATSTVSLSTSFSSDVVLLLGATQSLVAPAGEFSLSTIVDDGVAVGIASTPVTRNETSTTTKTRTVRITGPTVTVTKTLNRAGGSGGSNSSAEVNTTAVTSQITSTIAQRMDNGTMISR